MSRLGASPLVRQPPDAVLDHDDARIDEHPEVDRPQAHQAGRDPRGQHHVGREEHRQRDRQRHDQPAADVAQQRQQDHDDQDAPFDQVAQDRAQGLVDQVGAVVERLDRDALGQAALEPGDLLLDVADDPPRVLADEHHHQPGDDLALAVAGHQPGADHRRGVDLGHVGDRHGDAVALVDDDRGDVGHVVRLALAADVPRLPLVHEVAAADVGVVHPQRVEDVGHRQVVGPELVGVELDLVGLQLAAVRVDLGHAGHAPQLVGDEPVEDRPQLHRRDARLAGRLDLELEDLAQRRRDRPERRGAVAPRDRRGGAGEPLADELPGAIEVGPLLEDDRHDRDAELRDRADLRDVGQAAHRPLDRERDQRLDLQRAERGGLGDHLDLDVGQVRDRVDRQVDGRVDPQPRDQERPDDHEEPVLQGGSDDRVEHGVNPPRSCSGGSARS